LEFDGLDDHAVHYLLSEDGKDVATARWIEKPEGVKIERFAVLKEYRNKAYGTLLLKYILVELVLSKKPIFLHSQESAVKFYSVNGFDIEGDDFKEAGIIKDVTAITAHMNNARRWHKFDSNMTAMPGAEPVPPTMDWDTWLGTEQWRDYNKDYVNGQWRCWYDYGMGALGDWGAHILDTAHEFLELGYPTEINMLYAKGHNKFFFPYSSTIQFKFPARKDMPACDITWYDGMDNLPPVPAGYGNVELDPTIPPPSNGQLVPSKLNPGKIIYSKELTFKGGSHGSTLSIIPAEKAQEMASKLPVVPKSTSNHFANFLLACKGQEKTRSPFEVAGPLSQVFCLGVIAQQLNAKLKFDAKLKKFTNNDMANKLLVGTEPRKEWMYLYKL